MIASGKEILGNPVGNCAEAKAASAASKNSSQITGMDTRWRHGGNYNYPYTGNDKTSDSQMDPCKTCETFEYEYMEYANKGKR